jgi:hypothetical protein
MSAIASGTTAGTRQSSSAILRQKRRKISAAGIAVRIPQIQ